MGGGAGTELHALQLQIFEVPTLPVVEYHGEIERADLDPWLRPRIDVAGYAPAAPVPVLDRGLIDRTESDRVVKRRIVRHQGLRRLPHFLAGELIPVDP